MVDLTLSGRDLFDRNTGGWNERHIRQIIAEEDVDHVLRIKPNPTRVDSMKWGFSNNGIYNSKSGYKLLENIQDHQAPVPNSMPPLEHNPGRTPSYAWRSILHVRDLLSQGLIKEIGNIEDTRVWLENWILETTPRPPNYRQDAMVDLTLSVKDLFDRNTGGWNERHIRQIIAEEDVDHVLRIKPNPTRVDSMKWGFSNNGIYNSKSGYKLLENIQDHQAPVPNSMPPLEQSLEGKNIS
ncbi:hypothetical protein F2Q69_00041943 [Brassica cretica]|uniref:Uncharacterized protein n=1 Tax=Brassica cretica TaxID=69181 RepID=A0A8S9NS20_BRACR|nr:hypothetical protein F2Q69_00041943 [Brassica cretica]